jgi:hypothetical protein
VEEAGAAFVFEAIAVPPDGDRRRVMQEAVQERRGEGDVGAEAASVAVGFVAGEDDRAPLVATATPATTQRVGRTLTANRSASPLPTTRPLARRFVWCGA